MCVFVWGAGQAVAWDGNPAGVDNGAGLTNVQVGDTRGGFLFVIRARNLGKLVSNRLQVEVLVGGALCPIFPMVGFTDPVTGDFVPDSLYTVEDDDILNGRLVCASPAGQGRNVSVVVRHKNADDTSEPRYFDFNPPSAVTWVQDGAATAHWLDGVSGQQLRVTGKDLGVSATVRFEDTAFGDTFVVPAVFTTNHTDFVATAPTWQGANLRVYVTVSGQTAPDELLFSFARPTFTVTVQSEYVPTNGSTPFVLEGNHLGMQTAPSSGATIGWVTVGGVLASCPVWTPTRVECVMPAFQGAQLDVVAHVGGQTSQLLSSRKVSYSAPELVLHPDDGPWMGNTSALRPRVLTDPVPAEILAIATNISDILRLASKTVPVTVQVTGRDFGTQGSVLLGPDAAGTMPVVELTSDDPDQVPAWSHTRIVFRLPPGSGRDLPIRVRAGAGIHNQTTPVSSSHLFSYRPPWVEAVDPPHAPADGCHKWESIGQDNRGVDTTSSLAGLDGLRRRVCCQPALVRVTGANLGSDMRGLVVTVDGVDITRSCADAVSAYSAEAAYLDRLAPPDLVEGAQCSPDCLDAAYASRNRAECESQSCCHYNYPRNLWDVDSCLCPVPPLPCILSHTHGEIAFRPPPGFGLDASMAVSVSAQDVAGLPFEFHVPEVSNVVARPYNAQGERIRIEGVNFARPFPVGPLPDNPSRVIGSNLTVTLDGLECEAPLWQPNLDTVTAFGLPFITCTTARDVVGPKSAVVTIADVDGETLVEEQKFMATCLVSEYGRTGELCLPCPRGAVCSGSNVDLRSEPGWWLDLQDTPTPKCPPERQNRTACDVMLPCEPNVACTGNNTCAVGYTADRCSECVKGKYYRLDGECIKCPNNPWVLIVGALAALVCVIAAAYVLNRKSVNIAHLAIIVDYCQVLAIFARSKVEWPPQLEQLFNYLSALNINIDLSAPECSIPNLKYDMKWKAIQLLPLACFALLFLVYLVVYAYNRFIKRQDKHLAGAHGPGYVSNASSLMYFAYLMVTRTILDAFVCLPTEPDDGAPHGYMQPVFEPCYEEGGVHLRILPWAIVAFVFYALGYPTLIGYVMLKNRKVAEEDQLLRALGTGDSHRTNPNAYVFRRCWHRLYYQYVVWGEASCAFFFFLFFFTFV